MKNDYFEHLKVYISSDFDTPKISTICFSNFLQRNGAYETTSDEVIVDLGCGGGSGLYYFAKAAPNSFFSGIDYNHRLIDWVNSEFLVENKQYILGNMNLIYGDWNDPCAIKSALSPKKIAGITSVHSLCTQRSFEGAAANMLSLNPNWIAFNSLFYDGPLDVLIHVRDRSSNLADDNPDADFNIHSLQHANEYMANNGFELEAFEPFDIGTKLAQPPNGSRGTYTIKTEWSDFTQFSGPVHLPWHFLLYRKSCS